MPMAQRRSLGPSGGAGGVDHKRQVLGIHGDIEVGAALFGNLQPLGIQTDRMLDLARKCGPELLVQNQQFDPGVLDHV